MNISGLAALVTGGASGLGEATARALAAGGAKVALLDMNAERGAQIASEIGGIRISCNVTSEESVEAAIAEARAAHGAARILVNCAGVAPGARVIGRNGPMPLADFKRGIDVNLIGTFNVIRLFAADAAKLDPMQDDERGAIINTASIAAYEGQIGQASYAASKAGVIGMTLPIARELASLGIRVCTIAPGIFETRMIAGMSQAVQESLGASIPFPRRLGRATEYASLALHILGNVMLNGETIRLDGAIRMQPR